MHASTPSLHSSSSHILKSVEDLQRKVFDCSPLQPLDSVGSSPALSPPQEKQLNNRTNKERLAASGSCWTLGGGGEKSPGSPPSSSPSSSSSPPRVAWLEEGREATCRVKVTFTLIHLLPHNQRALVNL